MNSKYRHRTRLEHACMNSKLFFILRTQLSLNLIEIGSVESGNNGLDSVGSDKLKSSIVNLVELNLVCVHTLMRPQMILDQLAFLHFGHWTHVTKMAVKCVCMIWMIF